MLCCAVCLACVQYDIRVLHSGLYVDGYLRQPAREECEARERVNTYYGMQQELRRKDEEYLDTMWTLHELSNGAGHAALNLYRAGQLQERISYEARDRIQARIWRAESAMNREHAHEMYSAR